MDRPEGGPSRVPWTGRVRAPAVTPERVPVEPRRHRRAATRAPGFLALGFLVLIVVGSILLSLPGASRHGEVTPLVTALFTSASAVCVTGLVVVDTRDYWSPFGQAVILALIQVGGLGFLTSSTILLLLIGRRASLRERILLREAHGVSTLGGILGLTRQIVVVTLALQLTGSLVLSLRFAAEYPLDWALWMGLFHGISAFNNAGFDLMGGGRSLAGYSQDPVVLLVIALLVLLGAIGFTAIIDLFRGRKPRTLLLDSKLVLVGTAVTLGVGTFILLAIEYDNPRTLGSMSPPLMLLNALFMAVSRTSGFSSVNVGEFTEGSHLTMMAMMFIGGASGSMAGGIKMNTFAVVVAAVISSMKGRRVTTAFDREIPQDQVSRALTITLVGLALVFVLTLLLNLLEPATLLPLMFEATSALGIVGLSTGITPELSTAGKLLITLAMYMGRVGPLTLALALAARAVPPSHRYPEGRIKIG